METPIAEVPLPDRQRDHLLIGDYVGRRECHVEPDWLLIYKLEREDIIFERTGTHADLFR
jgi:mRNA interferase YafQ